MGSLRQGVPAAVLLSLAWTCAGCGGASSSSPPPPPAPDFTLSLSSNSISIAQGATSPSVNISVNAVNGFTGAVQVMLSALPVGVTSNPQSPFSVAAGASTPVIFGAAANAATGSFTISVQGASGTLSHSASLALAIQGAVSPALPRTAYARTDSTSASDDPFGEPHHRHIAYDPANKHLFVANRAMNRVEVFSTASQSSVAQISIPGASSADISADGSTVWVGTALEEIVAIDTSSLRIRNRSRTVENFWGAEAVAVSSPPTRKSKSVKGTIRINNLYVTANVSFSLEARRSVVRSPTRIRRSSGTSIGRRRANWRRTRVRPAC